MSRMTFRFHAAVVFALVLALAGCSRAPAADQAVLRVGVLKGAARATLEASHALDGAPYRVAWSEFSTGQELLEALAADAVDIGTTGDASFQFAFQAGRPIRAVRVQRAEDVDGASGILVPKASTIRKASDLKGRTIATSRGSAGHYLVLRALASAGLGPSAVHFTFLSPGDAKAALASNAVDGWATWPPYVGTALLHDGVRMPIDGHGLIRNYLLQVASTTAIEQRGALLDDFLARQDRASAWTNAHPEAAAKAYVDATGVPLDVARYTVDRQHWRPAPMNEDFVGYQNGLARAFETADVLRVTRDPRSGFSQR
jgi:sulfonate transport system substrate-binding protein